MSFRWIFSADRKIFISSFLKSIDTNIFLPRPARKSHKRDFIYIEEYNFMYNEEDSLVKKVNYQDAYFRIWMLVNEDTALKCRDKKISIVAVKSAFLRLKNKIVDVYKLLKNFINKMLVFSFMIQEYILLLYKHVLLYNSRFYSIVYRQVPFQCC